LCRVEAPSRADGAISVFVVASSGIWAVERDTRRMRRAFSLADRWHPVASATIRELDEIRSGHA
jgi:hypothetical protein